MTMAPAPADPAPSRRIRPQHVAAAVLFLAVVAVFSPVRNHQFIDFDDDTYVYNNATVARGLTGEGLRWAFTTFDAANWHPLTWLSHMLDVQLFGLAPGGHHVTSALIHALSAALLFGVLWGMTGAVGRSAAVAALFSLHPLRVESVAWIAERKDVLSGLFFMLTLLAYLRWVRLPRPGRYLAAIAAFALGLLSKPMLVTLPFVLLLLDFWPLGRLRLPARGRDGAPPSAGVPFSRLILEKAPFLALAAASSVVTVIAQQSGEAIRSVQRYPPAFRISNAVHSYVAYLGKTFWPTDLSMFYPHSGPGLDLWQALAAGFLVAGISVVAVLTARSLPCFLTGWFWYLGTLVPVIGLVHVGAQAMADRYTYLPLIGIFLAVAWGVPALLPSWRRRGMALAAGTAAVCVLLGFLTIRQLETMRDSGTLFGHMLSVDPDNDLALYKMGALLVSQGRIEEGTALLKRLYRRNPLQLSRVQLQQAERLAAAGKVDEALLHYAKVLELDPLNTGAMRAVSRLKAERGRFPEGTPPSLASGETAGEQEANSWFSQGNALVAAGHFAGAVDYFRRAVEIKPDFAEAWNNLGSCYGKLERHREAAAAFEKAAAAAPGNERVRLNLQQARRSLR